MSDTLIWLGLWTLMLWGIGHLRLNLLVRRWTKLLCFPGLALEAICRALACVVTGTPVEKLRPFEDGQPFLRTGKCPSARVGVPIAMAVRMTLTFFVALGVLELGVPGFTESGFGLPTFLYHPDGITGSSGSYFSSLGDLPATLHLDTFLGWLVLYSLFTFALATGISAGEFFAALWGWGGIFAVSWVVGWLGIRLEFLSRGWFLRSWYMPICWTTFSLFVTLCLFALLFVMVLHALPNLAAKMKPKPTAATQGLAVGGR